VDRAVHRLAAALERADDPEGAVLDAEELADRILIGEEGVDCLGAEDDDVGAGGDLAVVVQAAGGQAVAVVLEEVDGAAGDLQVVAGLAVGGQRLAELPDLAADAGAALAVLLEEKHVGQLEVLAALELGLVPRPEALRPLLDLKDAGAELL